MDRLTGKTMECYVEFFNAGDAQAAVNAKKKTGNIHQLGDRVAAVEMSSQDNLSQGRRGILPCADGRPIPVLMAVLSAQTDSQHKSLDLKAVYAFYPVLSAVLSPR